MNFLTAVVITAFLSCTGIVSRALPVSMSSETSNPPLQSLTSADDEMCTLHTKDHPSLLHPSHLKVMAVCEPKDECQVVTIRATPDDNTYRFTCVRREEFAGYTGLYATNLPENEMLTTRTRPLELLTNKALSSNQRKESSSESRPLDLVDNLAETSEEEEPRPSYNVPNNDQEPAEGIHTKLSSDESKSIVRRSRPSEIVPNRARNPTTKNPEDSDAQARSEERFSEWVTNQAESKQGSSRQPGRERPVDNVLNQAQSSGASRRSANYRPTEEVVNRAQVHLQNPRQNVAAGRPSEAVPNRAQSSRRPGHKRPGHKKASRRPSESVPNMADRHH